MKFIKIITDYNNPKSLGFKFRQKRSLIIKELIQIVFREKGRCRIIDIGGTENYWKIYDIHFLQENAVSITLLNLQKVNVNSPIFTSDIGDACDLRHIATNSYDLAHSNSVIEHVGDWRKMEQFASEVARVANRYYVQTPNFWFPLEPHFGVFFFHWLPEPVRVSLLSRYNLGYAQRSHSVGDAVRRVQRAHLMDMKMFRYLFPDAEIRKEKLAFFTKSLIAIRK